MIERNIVADNFLEYQVSEYIRSLLGDVPIREISVEKNPVGERITIYTSTPGLVIGREGANIKKLTSTLKERFSFENPQIKIGEVEDMYLSAAIVAKKIANDLSNFGSQKFKLTGFRSMTSILNAGASGVEIRITGKLPSARSKSWRFAKGYIKKTGYVSDFLVDTAIEKVTLKTGVIGIKVSIMLPNTPLPDKIDYFEDVIPQEMIDKVEKEKKEDTESNETNSEDQEKEEAGKQKKSSVKKGKDASQKQKTNKEQSSSKKVEEEKQK